MDARSTLGVASRSLGAGSYVRHQLTGKSFHSVTIVGLYRDPQNRFFDSLRVRRIFLVGTNDTANCFDNRIAQCKTRIANTLHNKRADAARFGPCISADNGQRAGCSEAVAECGADFQRLRTRLAGCAADSDAIVAEIFRRELQKRYGNIRAQIIARVADLVDQLFLDRHFGNAAARASGLRDDGASVTGYLDDWEADVRGVGDVEPIGA